MNHLSLVLPEERWHPSVVAATARLFSISAPDVEQARVLEIDCGDGGNIISIAASLPSSSCTGVALSSEALDRGRNLISESGLKNVVLHDQTPADGVFDYIFLRNTYSRQQPDIRSEWLSSYAGKLAENGVIVVEHMCYPGWHFLDPIREQIQYHTRNIDDAFEKMIAGRQYLSALSSSIPPRMAQFKKMVRSAWERSTGVPDVNFGVEYLDTQTRPSYFHQFAETLQGGGYQYLCELAPGSMLINQFPGAISAVLPEEAGVIETEQYLDFVTNRTKRVSILCRAELEIERQIDASVCDGLYFSAAGLPENPEQIFQEEETRLTSPYGGTVTVSVPAAKAALLELCSRFPRRMQIGEVIDIVRDIHKDFTEADKVAIYETFAACAVCEIVQINSDPGQGCATLSEKPVASSLIRAQARIRSIPHVSSLQHRSVPVDQMDCLLLEMLDGNNDKAALIAKFRELVEKQSITLKRDDKPVADEATVEEIASQQIDRFLETYLARGFLES
ncbi:MAG: methyltransferase regulatory domain-containing protein [Verrucomicrobiales bacterium]|nr:methyltransferase regulatory domain-containing protein [Verrucomicrobiales bacterium]